VTFRQTDPLYVVDLADPTAPALLGELKDPGLLRPTCTRSATTCCSASGVDAERQRPHHRDAGVAVRRVRTAASRCRWTACPSARAGRRPADEQPAFGYDVDRRTALLPYARGTAARRRRRWGIRVEGRTLVEAGRLEVLPDAPAERVLHDADGLYAVSRRGVVAGSWSGFTRTGAVDFAR
jgi:hypothetical protein